MESSLTFPLESRGEVISEDSSGLHLKDTENQIFSNDVIMRRVISFLDLENISKCRLVCTAWKNFSEYRFRKIGKIVFDDDIFNSTRKTQNLLNFFQSSQSNIPFTAYKFEGSCRSFTRFRKVLFFKQSRKFVKELTLKCVTFTHIESKYSNIIDLGFNPSAITSLCITAQSGYGGKWTVSLNTLVSIQILELENCTVIVPRDNWKIFPRELKLKYIVFSHEEQKSECTFINDLVDFWRIERLELDSRIDKNMSIDLSDLPAFDTLSLSYVKVLNWGQCRCKVKKMTLRGIPYTEKNPNVQVKELKIDCSTVELSSLPDTVEKLQLTRNNVTCTHPVLFQNVTFLKYSKTDIGADPDTIVASIPNLDIFVNLVDISLKSPYTPIPLEVNSLPRMIRRMKLDNSIMIVGDGTFVLDTLIIKNGYWIDARKLLDKIKPSHLVLYRKHSSNLFKIKDIERILILIQKPFLSVTVGEIQWRDDDEFAQSNLPEFVDRKSAYYTFIHQRGKAIDENEFNSLVKLKF